MSLEEWVDANQVRDQWSDLVVPVIELREFMKGKALLSLSDAEFLFETMRQGLDSDPAFIPSDSVYRRLEQAINSCWKDVHDSTTGAKEP